MLLGLLQSNSFVSTLLQVSAPRSFDMLSQMPGVTSRDPSWLAGKKAQMGCHEWRLDVFGCSDSRPQVVDLSQESADEAQHSVSPRTLVLPPIFLRVICYRAPKADQSSIIGSLVAGSAAQTCANAAASSCLQRLLAFGMLNSLCTHHIFGIDDGRMYLHLFERFATQNHRVSSLCQLFLRGPLKRQVRCLLPKVLP